MAIVLDPSQRWRLFAAHVFLIGLCLLVVFPFLVVLSVSLRPGNFATGSLIPDAISLEHWRYALARMKFRGRDQVLSGLMLMQMFPAVLALVAIYAIFDRLGSAFPAFGIDSHWSLLLAYSGGIAGHVWTIKGYYDTIPYEVEEAAKVDGATSWQTFRLVLLPMALPILVVVFLLAFIGVLIEYPVASVLLNSDQNLTLAVGTKKFVAEHNFKWGDFAAVAILSGLPITAVFMLAQKWMIAGLTAGGIKG